MIDRPDPPLAVLSGVAKSFGSGLRALDGVDIAVRDGEFVSILGPSGCGKSTVLRILAGLTEASAGAVAWDAPIVGGKPRKADLGYVFQEPTLMPWASVADNVFLPLKLSGRSRAEAAPEIHAALDRVGLAEFARAYPRELSGGMKMRVSIARALVTRPKLLLMDEPFAALDEITRFRLNDDLLRVWASLGGSVLYVTHAELEAGRLSSRVVVMTPRPGRVFAEVAIDAPYPRDQRFRTSAEYAGYCRRASEVLAAAMRQGTRP